MSDQPEKRNGLFAAKLLLIACGMFGFGYALVPLYSLICDITGLGGKANNNVQVAREDIAKSGINYSRTITIEFVANNYHQGRWAFEPAERKVEVHPGEFMETAYTTKNLLDVARSNESSYNLAPGEASKYFQKIQCFCFTEQTFQPNQEREMPVIFRVSPDIPENINTITLAYQLNDSS